MDLNDIYRKAIELIESRLERSKNLPKHDITIRSLKSKW